MTIPLPLLITGITGVAGYNALAWFQQRFPGQVFGIRPHQTWQLVGPGILPCKLEDCDHLLSLFEQHSFRAVLNCTGNCALKSCELDPAMARRTNIDSARNIAEAVRRFDTRLVHLSSDLVFSGQRDGNYREDDPVDPVTVYGKTMVEGEHAILGAVPGAAVLRISLPMGPSFNGHAGAIDWILSRFRPQRPATLYFDEVRSATYVDDLSRVCACFLAGSASGLYHAGGPTPWALYQIGQIINRTGGFDPDLLKGCPRRDAGPMPPRAGNVSMDSRKLHRLLGSDPFRSWPCSTDLWPTPAPQPEATCPLEGIDLDWHRRRQPGERGSLERIAAWLYQPGDSARIPVAAGRAPA
jgi:dTDP-4-dehydrorhamnose reductase